MTIRNKLYYENRLNKLMNNGKDNAKVIKKIKRKLAMLNKED
jgi:hypothetical protein